MESETALRVAVASENPVKSAAIRDALEKHFPGQTFRIETFSVDSGVADQPMSDEETLRGALNRVAAVRTLAADADLWAGLEGGVDESKFGMLAFAWIVVETANLQGIARTATFPLPESIAERLRNGEELGHVNDSVFGLKNSKHNEGAIGTLTDGLIDRQQLYVPAAIMAMIPVKHEKLFRKQVDS